MEDYYSKLSIDEIILNTQKFTKVNIFAKLYPLIPKQRSMNYYVKLNDILKKLIKTFLNN